MITSCLYNVFIQTISVQDSSANSLGQHNVTVHRILKGFLLSDSIVSADISDIFICGKYSVTMPLNHW